jgi:hypothetical protein
MLVRGERWIVVRLARVGGRPSEGALQSSGYAKLDDALRGWNDLIAKIDRTKRTFQAGETAAAARTTRNSRRERSGTCAIAHLRAGGRRCPHA